MKTKNFLFIAISLLLGASLFITGCKKDDPEVTETPETPDVETVITIKSTPRFVGTVDGVEVSYIEGNKYFGYCSGSSSTGETSGSYKYGAGIADIHNVDEPMFDMTYGTFSVTGGSPSNETFSGFFTTGSKPYSFEAEDGIEIQTVDSDGLLWSTSLGTANQDGSVFTIDDLEDAPSAYEFSVKFKCSFSCKLYNSENADVKTIEDAVFVGYFKNMM